MILEKTAVEQLIGFSPYQGDLLKRQISYRILQHELNPLGNIFCFETSLSIGKLVCANSLILAGEITNTNMFGGICFERLYATELGSLLTHLTKEDHYTDGSSIFSTQSQISLTLTNQVKDVICFHMIFPLEFAENWDSEYGLKCLSLDEEKLNTFKATACEIFNVSLRNIYLDTRCDNI